MIRQVKILPEIPKTYNSNQNSADPIVEKKVNAFSIPVREDIQMVYNTVDGSTVIAKDLKAAPKFQGDNKDLKNIIDKDKNIKK